MIFKLGAILIVIAQIRTTLALPPCVCGRNLLPVCGSNGVTYSNQCMLECKAFTSKTEITATKLGPCDNPTPPDACICNLAYRPVCGSDGQTYGNECGLNCHKSRFNPNLTVVFAGHCNAKKPEAVCPAIYSPVCGSDGNTYGNDCFLNGATVNNSGLRVAYQGPCKDRVLVQDI